MQNIGICGHFGGNKDFLDGQTIKTKNLTDELIHQYGKNEVNIVDTYGGMKRFPILIIKIICMQWKCRNIVILPAQTGLNSYVRIMMFLNVFLKRNIHYAVIGGWLPQYLEKRPCLAKQLKMIKGIYVETSVMKASLVGKGFANIQIMRNFKKIRVLEKDELIYINQKPLKLCTFSRVMKEKGIENAINVIKTYNQNAGEEVFALDIYGQVDRKQTEWFSELEKIFPNYVQYKGAIPSEQSVNVLKEYYALLFPTNFYTEGIPGTIIDAYAAGIPVICSKWESFPDVVDEKITGFGFEFSNQNEFIEILQYIANNVQEVNALKQNCIEKAKEYSSEIAVLPLVRGLQK